LGRKGLGGKKKKRRGSEVNKSSNHRRGERIKGDL